MKSVIYIGPKSQKDLRGYIMPFGVPVEVPEDVAREALRYPHLFTTDPNRVPDPRPGRVKLLQAEIRAAVAYREQYRDDLTFAKREKDKDKAKLIMAACKREMDYADAKIKRCEMELAELMADEQGETPAEGDPESPPEAPVEETADKPVKGKRRLDTGTPVEEPATV